MEDALSDNETPVTLLRYEKLDHGLNDSNARQQMLVEIGKLLDHTIGS
jgi:dipeptidyl aminopeptidase/acylaminoacyl peptidase